MDKFIIEGGVPLKGEVTPAGNKNAALPLVAACLLTKEPVVLRNVPRIQDVQVMRDLVESLGGKIVGLGFVVELEFLPGRKKLEGYDVRSLIKYQS